MISQAAEYALRAVVCLAQQTDRPLTTQQIAAAARIPVSYLAKVMQTLVKGSIVTSQRGPNGGFVLAAAPAHLTLLDIVCVVDCSRRIETCPLGIEAHGKNLCSLHRRLDAAAASVEELLRSTTVEELLVGTTGAHPLCDHEPAARAPERAVALD